ncbi:MAG: hypothetical protein L0323_04075 [Planctomycetes bacterium]|nr:hypothetical protein [Planctomycetota bacterium]
MSSNRIALSFASLLCAGSLRAQEIGGRSLEEWRALILPRPEECSWEAIPWRPTFWGAVREAQERERPILLWAMNGHPLGCT